MLAERAATWPKQWMDKGFEKGRTSGVLEGQRLALAALAKEKFGGLEARFMGLISEASGDQLRNWLKKILTATTPDDLFRN